MDYIRLIRDTEAVFRISLNREDVHTAEEAMHAWLPLVSRLQPMGVQFTETDSDALRHGFLAELMVARPLPGRAPVTQEFAQLLQGLLTELDALALRVEFDEERDGMTARARMPSQMTEAGCGPHGVFVLFGAVGYDPLNPEGGTMDYDEEDDEELLPEGPAFTAESADFQKAMQDLLGLMMSVKIEAKAPLPGAAERLADRIRIRLGHPQARIQAEDDGLGAALGPMGDLKDDDLEDALGGAMTVLGGSWGEVVVVETSMGPVHYAVREEGQGLDEAGTTRVHLWAGSTWALVRHIEEHPDTAQQ